MRSFVIAAALAAVLPSAIAAPALAQSRVDQQRWDAAQARYQQETDRYYAERDRYYQARGGYRGGVNGGAGGYRPGPGANNGYGNNGYGAPPPPPPGDDRYEGNYDPSRYYRDGPGYQERTLAADDRVYRGSDGQYYCKRSDGTTGLVIGAAGGGILGNVIDGGHSRTAGTLIGAAIGALAGKAADQQSAQVRCR